MSEHADTKKNSRFPPWLSLIILVALAFFTRLFVSNLTAIIYPDGAIYLEMARDISEGQWNLALRRIFHPAFPVVIALVYQCTGLSLENAGFLSANILGALTIIPIFLSARVIAQARGDQSLTVPVIASLLAILHDNLLVNTAQVLAYSVSHLAVATTSYFLLRALIHKAHRKKAILASGAAVAVAYLARPDGLLIMTGLGFAYVFLGYTESRNKLEKTGRAFLYGALFSIAALGVSSPYMTWVSVESGRFRLTLKKDPEAWVRGKAEELAEAKRFQALRQSILNHERSGEAPARVPSILKSLSYTFKQSLKGLSWPLLLGLLASLLALREQKRLSLLFAPALLLFLGHIFLHYHAGYLSRRHASYHAVIFLPMAALGVLMVAEALKERIPALKTRSQCFVLLPLLLAMTAPFCLRSFRPHLKHKAIARELGTWIAEHHKSDSTPILIGDEVRVVAFYGGAEFIDLQKAGEEKSRIDEARLSGSAYYVLYLRTRKREMNPSIPRQLKELGAEVLLKRLVQRRDIRYHWWVLRLQPAPEKRRPQ